MAVALRPTASLYSTAARAASEETSDELPSNPTAAYSFATLSPRRHSLRLASHSPTRRPSATSTGPTTFESDDSDSGTSSVSSPSRRHSLRVQQRLGVGQQQQQLSLLPMREISTNNLNDSKPASSFNSSSSSSRPRQTLNVLPTDLRTPSTTTAAAATALTPAVSQLTLSSGRGAVAESTPSSASARNIEDFVSSVEMEEIAKATPLGSFYYNNNNSNNNNNNYNNSHQQQQQPQQQQRHSSQVQPMPPMKPASKPATSNNNNNNNNTNPLENISQISQTLIKSYNSRNAAGMVIRPKESSTTAKTTTATTSTAAAAAAPKTPPKQIIQDEFIETASGTVRVVRTLRNRSIIASPFPTAAATTERRRRSLAAPTRQAASQQSASLAQLLRQFIVCHCRNALRLLHRHQRNLLVFPRETDNSLDATGPPPPPPLPLVIQSVLESKSSNSIAEPQQQQQQPLMPVDIEARVKEMFDSAHAELQQFLEQKLQDASLFTRDPAGSHHLKPEVYSLLLSAIPSGDDSSAMKEYVDRQLQHVLKQITKKLDSRPAVDPAMIAETIQGLESRIERIERKLREAQQQQQQKPLVADRKKDSPASASAPASEKKPVVLNMFDYAAAGAKIIPALTTSKLAESRLDSWRRNDASVILKSDLSRDAFFAFAGNRGKVALSFANPIRPTHITLDFPLHLTNLDKSCAPKDFELWALPNPRNERDSPRLLGSGTFDASSGQVSQTFLLQNPPKTPIRHVQLRIRNNHGNGHSTRLYRLRIHQQSSS